MDGTDFGEGPKGANQIRLRAHNERLILSLIQRQGPMPGMDLAKSTGLSAQTVSNILRKLEADGFLTKGEPQRGKIGKPSIPMVLNPDGALSFGLKLGRRTSDLVVMNLYGQVLDQKQIKYRYPMPEEIFGFLRQGIESFTADLSELQRERLCGIGISAPSEIWSWIDVLGAPEDFTIWREIDFQTEVAKFSDLPLFTENDATAACRAEHAFGRGREFSNYAYFYVGSFVGGGVVMNRSVVDGEKRNAGAFGSLYVPGPEGGQVPLLDAASLYLLEAALLAADHNADDMWRIPQDWSGFGRELDAWIVASARALAHASRSACAVIDFQTVLIDGAFPENVRQALVLRMREELAQMDMRGLFTPRLEEAQIGGNARAIGAASAPIFSQFFLP
ncbi:MAG: ROK family protein [Mangrovicoccus sp.]